MTIFDTFMQHCDNVFLTCALYNHEVFDKESVFDIPSYLQTPTSRIK
jgi:hypothetical protein